MAFSRDYLIRLLVKNFPDAEIELEDVVGDQNHFELRIRSAQFNGMPRVAQHKAVYKALQEPFSEGLHALVLKTEPKL
ncbi:MULTISPECIES: BolA/IbaG family iron-sulfur metabolism protein [unclassified Candidatus Lariskella]|uniref:BolA/IbaG family iron-sulfur metabolism protein n=1 Tax=unclassified Candidatus Lariskella TaxID=2632605 RepID=UPI0030D4A238